MDAFSISVLGVILDVGNFREGMDKSSQKRHLHEESDSSSDKECLATPSKQPNISIETKSPEIIDMSLSPEEASIPEAADSEMDPVSATDECGVDILATAALNIKYLMEDKYNKRTPGSPKYSDNEVIDFSFKNVSTTTVRSTSITPDSETELHPSRKNVKDSPEYASAKALEDEYMVKYASVYTKELLFSIDVMTLVRHLNGLPCKWIIYVTSGDHPKSPCNDLMDEALGVLWTDMKDDFGDVFEKNIKTNGIDYYRFQDLIVRLAEKAESKKYNEKYFLMYCVAIADWAVRAERNGVPDAPGFIPLVICRTIQNFKDSGKIPPRFWSKISDKAVDIICGDDKS